MNLTFNETWQYIAWFLALIEIIVGLYILALNIWNNANRHVGVLLLLIATSTLSTGLMFTTTAIEHIVQLLAIQAMVVPAIQIGLLIVTAILLAPQMMRGRGKWLWAPIYVVAFLPALLTIVDTRFGTQLWFTPTSAGVIGPQVAVSALERGLVAVPLRILGSGLPVVGILLALYTALRKNTPAMTRQLAWLLCGGLLVGSAIQFGLRGLLTHNGTTLLSSFVFAILYTYIGFQQMVSERRLQGGRLQPRLTLLVLAVATPVIIAVAFLLSNLATRSLGTLTDEQLSLTNRGLKNSVQAWVTLNTQTLQELVSLPDIISMDPVRQKPVLKAIAAAHPQMYLVMTMNPSGMNIARNDAGQLQNYRDRKYFIGAMSGTVTLEAVVSRTTGKPALAIAAPIKDASGNIIGVGTIASELGDLSTQVNVSKVGKTGEAYVVDSTNRIVAHSNLTIVTKPELVDAAQLSPVAHLRQNKPDYVIFADETGIRWHSYVDKLDNGWGVVVQQQESELLNVRQAFQTIAWITVLAGALMLGTLVSLTIRQAIQPVNSLTQATAAIAAGDLTRTAPIESEDELGALARSFNSMTAQLRGLIGGLEQRVADRTADLKRRSEYLAASAEVARAAGSILETDRLVKEAVELIRERFGLYYVGLFLVDEKNEWAVLRAGTGTAGQAMLAREHKLAVGGSSMIGWSITNAQARIALQAEADAVRRATAELPETRSEAALPLRSRGKVLGALTVQSAQPNAFDQDTVTVLQTMADLIAIALENARLLAESQSAVEAMRRASGELSRESWSQILHAQSMPGVRSLPSGVTQIQGDWPHEAQRALQEGRIVHADGGIGLTEHNASGQASLAIPVKVRGNVIGVIDTAKPAGGGQWTPEEIALAETLADQLGTALESARLYQDTQRRAAREQLTRQITDNIRAAASVEDAIQRAIQEMSRALGAEIVARIGTEQDLLAERSASGNGDSDAPGGKA